MAATLVATSTVRVAAEPGDELFALLDEHGNELGVTEQRKVVHAKGLYHRAVYCFVLNSAGDLLLQQRSHAKKVGPGQWDLSIAEHLQPGEPYADAVVRGLQEELGVAASREQLHGPLGPAHVHQLHDPEHGVIDNEYVQSYVLPGYEGPVEFNEEEVSAVRYASLAQVQDEVALQPERFTSWLRKELGKVVPLLAQEVATLRQRSGS